MTVVVTAVMGVVVAWVLVRQGFVGRATDERVRGPAVRALPRHGRAWRAILLFGLNGWFVRLLRLPRHPDRVRAAVDDPGDDLHLDPVRDPRGAAGPRGAGHGGGGRRADARRSVWKSFFRVTVPNIRWALLYGVALSAARAIGRDRRGATSCRARSRDRRRPPPSTSSAPSRSVRRRRATSWRSGWPRSRSSCCIAIEWFKRRITREDEV